MDESGFWMVTVYTNFEHEQGFCIIKEYIQAVSIFINKMTIGFNLKQGFLVLVRQRAKQFFAPAPTTKRSPLLKLSMLPSGTEYPKM
jgi:hypothetical protein